MTLQELLEQDKLQEAIAQLQQNIQGNPNDCEAQFLLFELLALSEDFDGAESALRTVSALDAETSNTVDFFIGILQAERLRYNFWVNAEGSPSAIFEPPTYASAFIDAHFYLHANQVSEAESTLQAGWEQVPQRSGTLNNEPFTAIRDLDDILGPFLEIIVPGQYFWVPFDHIQRLDIPPLRSYPDTIWMPVDINFVGGRSGNAWIPSLYSGTGHNQDGKIQFGRMTLSRPSASLVIQRYCGQRDLKISESSGDRWMGIRQVSSLVFDADS